MDWSITGLTSYFDGLTVFYRPNVAGASTTTLNINSLGAKTCYVTGSTKLTTHYGVGSIIRLTYYNAEWHGAMYDSGNTKDTAGATNTSSKIYIVGTTSQATGTSYTQDTAYVGTDGHVYSNSIQTVNLSDTQALTNKTYNGLTLTKATTGFTIAGGTTSKTLTVSNTYTLGAACAKGVTDNSSSTAVTSSDTNLITGRTLYYAGYVKIADVKRNACFKVTITNISSLPVTKNVSGCTTSHEVITSSLSNPNAQSGDWTIDTGTAGKITVSGTVTSGETTTLTLFMGVPESVSGT